MKVSQLNINKNSFVNWGKTCMDSNKFQGRYRKLVSFMMDHEYDKTFFDHCILVKERMEIYGYHNKKILKMY